MSSQSYEIQQQNSYLEGDNITYIEGLYETYLSNPDALSEEWRGFFEGLQLDGHQPDASLDAVRNAFLQAAQSRRGASRTAAVAAGPVEKELAVLSLIQAYREYGHLKAETDPLGLATPISHPELALSAHGLSDADLNSEFYAGKALGMENASLKAIIEHLENCYCGHTGVEYMHMSCDKERHFIREHVEAKPYTFSEKEKMRMLNKLIAADGLEKYLGIKYVGQKRFSLEGGDALIPMLAQLKYDAVKDSIDNIVIGMAHRGRLSVLVNTIGKKTSLLFDEFEGKNVGSTKTGDVKYHMGYSNDVICDGKPIHVSLAFNPSHLEIVSPVVQGAVRAKQFRLDDKAHQRTIAVMIHGDSAVAGQGVVFETVNMAQLRGYEIGGSIHIVINNQVGFTTSNVHDTRSSHYCSDVAKVTEMPIFHVNGDDPEAVCRAMRIAMLFRNEFKKDVMIDLICYRRLGHNEADDPSITQPAMYAIVKKHPVPAKVYADYLIQQGELSDDKFKEMKQAYTDILDAGDSVLNVQPQETTKRNRDNWAKHADKELDEVVDTSVKADRLKKLGEAITRAPDGFNIHPQVKKLNEERNKMTAGELPMNWGYAENLAYASLLTEGYHVRLSGEDSGRGTFAHRHAEFHDAKTGDVYAPLCHLNKEQAEFEVWNSFLSEEAVMAFEYGYATTDPDYLVLWEAQFGDFANGAQVVIDQFISSGEQKWDRYCGLVLLLPHGYEGMGPEHSSARLERYLQLCAQRNMQVCVPSTPAQMFHLLRRQMLRPARKPLIVMTPKALLRHKLAVSELNDLSEGQFHLLIPEVDEHKDNKIERIVVCSGKVYYDLLQKRRDEKLDHVAILRAEQLYPFPRDELKAELKRYKNAKTLVWCQEEPKNQGAWYQIQHNLVACLEGKSNAFCYAGRAPSAAPAVGYAHRHQEEQKQLVEYALLHEMKSGF